MSARWPVEPPADLSPDRRQQVAGVLAVEVGRDAEVPVDVSAIVRWCEAHREGHDRHWPGPGRDVVAPPTMLTAFTRPLEWRPGQTGPPTRGVVLHDRLKAALDLPVGIGRGYELELRRPVVPGDRLRVAERIVAVSEERPTRLGPGRDWTIEVTTTRADGATVGVERWSLVGYTPGTTDGLRREEGGAGGAPEPGGSGSGAPVLWREEIDVDASLIVMGAAANRVWAPQHHDHRAAQEAGAPDIFLDTSTQLGLWATMAAAHADDRWVRRATLRMRRPICPGDRLEVIATAARPSPDEGEVEGRQVVDVVAAVGDRPVSESRLTLDHRLPDGDRGP